MDVRQIDLGLVDILERVRGARGPTARRPALHEQPSRKRKGARAEWRGRKRHR
jgi:hypothetical protein